MPYGYSGEKTGRMSGGYSYATLMASMDLPSDGYDARFGRFGRHQSFSAGQARIDRRFSPPPPRHRPDATNPSSLYNSLHPSHHREKDKDHQRRGDKAYGDHGRRPGAALHAPPTRPTAKHSQSHNAKTRRDSKAGPEGKRHSTQILQPAQSASPHRKSVVSTSKKHSHNDHKATSCTGRHSTASSRTKATRSISSKKSTSRKSKPKSKGMFGWGCFGM
ncbi:hypothetical protein CDD82_5105 [Ophiocordyceps australis]|uniref:Uncharacterized protein n=1 Tax=Ophiocordyceps australis TaxID=1399860 RepID=A0A2C5YWZ9_9HYPO|nr:hypothetical protein CDD82_5105 [Ophiocordyceps australis]